MNNRCVVADTNTFKRILSKNAGLASFCMAGLLIGILSRLGAVTFESVLPYLIGIGAWEFLWRFCEGSPSFRLGRAVLSAALLSVLISFDLCLEGFLGWPMKPIDGLRFVLSCMVIGLFIYSFVLKSLFEKDLTIAQVISGGGFGVFSCAGNYTALESVASLQRAPFQFILLCALSVFSWTVLFVAALNAFHEIVGRLHAVADSVEPRGGRQCFFVWCSAFLICMLCYLPYLLMYYPAIIEYDSWIQIQQVFGSPYNNHHPWLHTMMIKALYNLGKTFFHSENRAIALYSLCSMGMLSVSFATAVAYFYRRGVKKIWLTVLLLASALSPINGIYSITIWKDIPFASMVLLFIIIICKLKDNMKQGHNNILYWLLFVPVCFGLCFFRTNGLYVFILMIPILWYVLKRQRKTLTLAVLAVLLLAGLYKGPIFRAFGVQKGDLIESLSIPAQQIAAVISYHGNIEEEDIALLDRIVKTDKIAEAYLSSPTCSDHIKDLVRETDNQQYIADHIADFAALWVKLGLKNPYFYLRAYIEETRGFWYHKVRGWIWTTQFAEHVNGLGICRECKLPDRVAGLISGMIERYPEYFFRYFSCGLYCYVMLFGLYESIRRKREKWFVFAPLVGIWFTLLIATPLCSDLRYIYAIHVALPYAMMALVLPASSGSSSC